MIEHDTASQRAHRRARSPGEFGFADLAELGENIQDQSGRADEVARGEFDTLLPGCGED